MYIESAYFRKHVCHLESGEDDIGGGVEDWLQNVMKKNLIAKINPRDEGKEEPIAMSIEVDNS